MVPVEDDATFTAGKPQLQVESPTRPRSGFGTPDYDVTADGRRFLMIPRSTQPRRRIHVILNWFEELRQLLPSD